MATYDFEKDIQRKLALRERREAMPKDKLYFGFEDSEFTPPPKPEEPKVTKNQSQKVYEQLISSLYDIF